MKRMRMPALFIGHGSPMNAIEDNAYTRAIEALGGGLPRPKAVLCVSAHWLTDGTFVTAMDAPRTIHDFGGFPEALYAIRYPAPGSPELAARVREIVKEPKVRLDDAEWGLDHGAWSVLMRLFPKADVPVVQLSVDYGRGARFHCDLGRALRPLRDEGVLIVGSGNVVHNLRRLSPDEDAEPFGWAEDFDAWIKERLERREDDALLGDLSAVPGGALSVPTTDHYDPLLYIVGAADEDETPRFVFEGIQNAAVSMRGAAFGLP